MQGLTICIQVYGIGFLTNIMFYFYFQKCIKNFSSTIHLCEINLFQFHLIILSNNTLLVSYTDKLHDDAINQSLVAIGLIWYGSVIYVSFFNNQDMFILSLGEEGQTARETLV